jgi:hypothetical protein
LALGLTAGTFLVAGCGDPQAGTIKRPEESKGVGQDFEKLLDSSTGKTFRKAPTKKKANEIVPLNPKLNEG